MDIIPLDIELILEQVRSWDYEAQFQKATGQVYLVYKIEDKEYPLFIKAMKESKMLQLLIFEPFKVEDSARGDLARLLHLLNKEMDLPGFGMDEKVGVVFYRCVLLSSEEGIAAKLIKDLLVSMPRIASLFSPIVEPTAAGAISYDVAAGRLQSLLKRTSAKSG